MLHQRGHIARKKRKSDQNFQVRIEEMGVPDAGERLRRPFDLILMAVTRAELSSAGSKEDGNGQIVNCDIILRTDGRPYRGGVLYQLEFEPPGQFAEDLEAEVMILENVDASRTTSSHPECE